MLRWRPGEIPPLCTFNTLEQMGKQKQGRLWGPANCLFRPTQTSVIGRWPGLYVHNYDGSLLWPCLCVKEKSDSCWNIFPLWRMQHKLRMSPASNCSLYNLSIQSFPWTSPTEMFACYFRMLLFCGCFRFGHQLKLFLTSSSIAGIHVDAHLCKWSCWLRSLLWCPK